jgi:hypothetical protein
MVQNWRHKRIQKLYGARRAPRVTGASRPSKVSSLFLVRVLMVNWSQIPGGGGGEGMGGVVMTPSRKKVVAEARGGISDVRWRRPPHQEMD